MCKIWTLQGRIQDFKLGGAHLKKLHLAEGGANIFGVFRLKNHDFTPKKYIFSNFSGGASPSPLPGSDLPFNLYSIFYLCVEYEPFNLYSIFYICVKYEPFNLYSIIYICVKYEPFNFYSIFYICVKYEPFNLSVSSTYVYNVNPIIFTVSSTYV